MNIALAVTAAGRSVRFGTDKLSYPYQGKTLGEICLSLYSDFTFIDKVVVLNSTESIMSSVAERYQFRPVLNPCPEKGLSSSVKLAVQSVLSAFDPDGIMFATADMPFLSPDSINKLISAFVAYPDHICSLTNGISLGKPVIFPKQFFPQFSSIKGDIGGKEIIKNNLHLLKTVTVSPDELLDIDTKADADLWLRS